MAQKPYSYVVVKYKRTTTDQQPVAQTLKEKCEQTKKEVIARGPLQTPRENVIKEIESLEKELKQFNNKTYYEHWEKFLNLNELKESLQSGSAIDTASVDQTIARIKTISNRSYPSKIREFRKVLENTKEQLSSPPPIKVEADENESKNQFFDSLTELIGEYFESPDTSKALTLGEAISYLEETYHAKEFADALRQELVKENMHFFVTSKMIAPMFARDIDEPVDVNDNILGTYVRGSGTLKGESSGKLIPSQDSAIIRVTMQGKVSTRTIGANGPVQVYSNNATRTATTKDIIITKNSIKTTQATTKANLNSNIERIATKRNGPLIRAIAPQQVYDRKPASEAESRRLTERRISTRVNKTVDENINEINTRLKWLIDHKDVRDSMSMELTKAFSTENSLNFDAIITGKNIPTTFSKAPVVDSSDFDLFVQVHESLPNNSAFAQLSEKTVNEETALQELKEQFPKLIEKLLQEKPSDEPPLTLTFSDLPVNVSFDDNKIKIEVETTAIERNGSKYPGMLLMFAFEIRKTDGEIELVTTEQPQVFPLGFNPETDKMSASETTIRAVVMKRLERITKEPMKLQEQKIEGENGTMTVKLAYLSTQNGWLSAGYQMTNWEPKTKIEE